MQSQDNNEIPDRTSFEKYRDPKFRGRKSHKVTSILKNEAHHVNVRRLRKVAYTRYCSKLKYVPHSDFPSSPQIKRTSVCDNSVASNSKFRKREITTIHEEIVLYKTKSHSSRKEAKAYKEKVASLKNIVKRLREMGVAKKETMQNKLPEDVTRKFSSIQL